MDKLHIAEALTNSQDFGEKLKIAFLETVGSGAELPGRYENDFLTRFILEGVKSADDFDDVQRHIDYGIDQLQRAAIALKKIEPKEA